MAVLILFHICKMVECLASFAIRKLFVTATNMLSIHHSATIFLYFLGQINSLTLSLGDLCVPVFIFFFVVKKLMRQDYIIFVIYY